MNLKEAEAEEIPLIGRQPGLCCETISIPPVVRTAEKMKESEGEASTTIYTLAFNTYEVPDNFAFEVQ